MRFARTRAAGGGRTRSDRGGSGRTGVSTSIASSGAANGLPGTALPRSASLYLRTGASNPCQPIRPGLRIAEPRDRLPHTAPRIPSAPFTTEASMKRFLPAGLLALVMVSLVALPTAGRADEIKWRDWNSGLKEAESAKKPVLVDVYTDWCGWCKRMDRDVYARADVRDYLARRFVTIRLNAEASAPASYEGKAYTARSLASRFRVTGYPTTIFLRAAGDHLANVPGYVPADRFLLLLRYIGDGHLDRGVSFDDFAKKEGAAN